MTEKPIAITTERADQLIAATEKAGVKLGVMFQDRVKLGIRLLKEWLSQGILGKLLLVDARVKWYRAPEYYSNSRWRGTFALDSGGAVINQGVHTLDLILWLAGNVDRVQAKKATTLHTIEAEDTAVALLEFADGVLGVFQATTAAYPGYARRVEITGTEGTVILEHDQVISVDLRTVPAGFNPGISPDANQGASSAVVNDFRGHQVLIEDFIDAIRNDRPPICDGREGRKSLALAEAIYRAADKAVENPDVIARTF
jgi:UDP-N-acetyl-2-amino-2-deoxyglucuronate dehydrogenase